MIMNVNMTIGRLLYSAPQVAPFSFPGGSPVAQPTSQESGVRSRDSLEWQQLAP